MIKWFRSKITKWLGIDDLLNMLDKHIDNNDNSFRTLKNETYDLNVVTRRDLGAEISHFQQSVNTLQKTVENVVHIGTDVDYYNGSWAVICIEGKINIVKFVDLDRKDARYVLEFLKQFEAGKHCIDSPYKEMFIGDMFKF